MRIVVVFVGLTVLFGSLFNLQSDLFRYLPSELYAYPRKGMTSAEYNTIVLSLRWVIPAIVVALFLWLARIRQRITPGWGTTLVTVGTVLCVMQFAMGFLASLIPGGGPGFIARDLLGYASFPIKVILFIGAVRMLMTLKPAPAAQQAAAADAQQAARG
jgi:hypothetical protein